jgi:hypothetical protein
MRRPATISARKVVLERAAAVVTAAGVACWMGAPTSTVPQRLQLMSWTL